MTITITALDAIAARANDAHRQVNRSSSETLSLAKQAGEILQEAKSDLKHGEWIPWLESNFEGSVRTAQLYLQVFENWAQLEANTQHVSHLSLRGALASISDKEPSPDMSELHDSVETITKAVLKTLSKSGQSLKTVKHKAEAISETILTGAVNTPTGEQVPATDYIASDVVERERQATIRQRDHVDEKMGRTWLYREQLWELKKLACHADLDAQAKYTKRWGDLLETT